MRAAIRMGISLRDYEDMTPHELNMHIEHHVEKSKRDFEERISLAYLTAAWSRASKVPSLKTIIEKLNEDPNKKQQTAEDMFAFIARIQAEVETNKPE